MKSVNLLRSLRGLNALLDHPLNRDRKAAAFGRWLRWKIASGLMPGPMIFRFVNDSVLTVEPGLNAATCNLYTGIYEFEDMAFALHLLREVDLFVDVGANIGAYTILSAAVAKASALSLEPIPAIFSHLIRNLNLNGIRDRVDARNVGVGACAGALRFTSDEDSVNHVATPDELGRADLVEVGVQTLDTIVGPREPTLIKIDVEGYETEVIGGAADTLTKKSLLAVIMELNGSSERYGHDDATLHHTMLGYGFAPFTYRPLERSLVGLRAQNVLGSNTLYIRDPDLVERRLRDARSFRVNGTEI